jgi:hypothetical protein
MTVPNVRPCWLKKLFYNQINYKENKMSLTQLIIVADMLAAFLVVLLTWGSIRGAKAERKR